MDTGIRSLIYQIVERHPEGVTHRGIVDAVLNSGYVHTGKRPVSEVIHSVMQTFLYHGVICRNEEETGIRKYSCV